MSDLNKSQQIPTPKRTTPPIPSREEAARDIKRLWTTCIALATIIFIVTGTTTGILFAMGMSPGTVVAVSTTIFQVLLLSYGMGFFVPAFLTSLKRLALGIEMNRQGLEIAEKTAQVLDKIDNAIEERIARVDRLIEKADKVAEALDDGKHPLLDRAEKYFSKELDKLRSEIRKERQGVEDELEAAIEEGEAEAAALDGDPCQLCGQLHEGPCMGFPCVICGDRHDDGRCPKCDDCQKRTGPHTHRKAVK